jgi:dTDP-4-amino-4,6-dideoxygalactose transaminase
MRKEFLVFGRPSIEEPEIDEVVDSMQKAWLGTGPKVARFEKDFASFKGLSPSRVAAVNSCTAALHVSLIAAGLQPGDEVITTAMTFCATVNAIIHSGATPVLADIDPRTLNLDPSDVERRITRRTKAILPVHFAGRPCEMDPIMAVAERHGLKVIEDCAHAIETEYRGRPAGAFGNFACFSFYATKNVVTGEGGMVIGRTTSDIERVKVLALHGMTKDAWSRFSDAGYKHYQVVECGFKYNMMDLQAAIGIHQLTRVDRYWRRREAIWNRYQAAFSGLPVRCPEPPAPDTKHAYHLYTLLVDKERTGVARDEFLDRMTQRRIGVGVHYVSIPEHPFYRRRYGWSPEDFPHAHRVGQQTVSVPLSPAMTDEDVSDVIEAVQLSLEGAA